MTDERVALPSHITIESSKRMRQHESAPTRDNHDGTSRTHTRTNTPSSRPAPVSRFDPDASIVLVGIRGSGKSTLAIIASTAMARRIVELDKAFQDATGLSTMAYKKAHGSFEYQRRQCAVLENVLATHDRDCIVVSSWMERGAHALLESFAASHPVIHITRELEAIQEYIKLADVGRVRELMKYTASTFRAVANLEFCNVSEKRSDMGTPWKGSSPSSPDFAVRADGQNSPAPYLTLKRAERHFLKFLSLVMPKGSIPFIESAFPLASVPTESRSFTYAVSIPLTTLLADEWETEDIETGADAIEIVIDDIVALGGETSQDDIHLSSERASRISRAFGAVRRNVVIPIIYHVPWPSSSRVDNAQRAVYLEHIQHGLRLCPEYMTVDMRLDDRILTHIMESKRTTQVIGAVHFDSSSPPSWSDPVWLSYYHRAQTYSCDLVKLVRPALSIQDNFEINMLRCSVEASDRPTIPLIAYNTGPKGKHSACFNKTLTSVLPESLIGSNPERDLNASYVAPSITPRQATLALQSCFATDDALKMYVLGADCEHSLSPAMHNRAIKALGLSSIYQPFSTDLLRDVRDLVHDPHFAGASVGLPFKVEVISLAHSLSSHAKAIGAVNTLIPIRHLNPDGSIPNDAPLSNARKGAGPVLALYGENTDWIGIRACIRRGLSPVNAVRSNTVGLVVGAGGMARAAVYAMLQLGVKHIVIHNRSQANAEKLVAHFERLLARHDIPLLNTADRIKTGFHILQSRDDPWPRHLRPPTMVVSCIPSQNAGDQPPSNFTLPKAWMHSPTGGVVVDFSYKDLNTPLIRQTRAEAQRGWVVMDSLDLLPEQGFAQFELFTGRRAPRRLMRAEVLRSSPEEGRPYPLQPRLDVIVEQEP
ncbi:shikimate dehydrogenase substrate binding domain-containing protein [Xylariaceae sp. FL1019]|nr:shikimate dehydrogenase substrate binding domain-containing protein [Xylariaceae sp. FL1019]